MFVRDLGEIRQAQVIDGCSKSNDPCDMRRPCFELIGKWCISCLFKRHRFDHVSTSLVRGHGFENLAPTVEDANAGWAMNLVPGKAIEIAADHLHVGWKMRDPLCAVDQYFGAGSMSKLGNAFGID